MDKRKMIREIRKKWDSPEKLLDYMLSFEKQVDLDREIIAKNILLEDIKNYSIAVAISMFLAKRDFQV